MLMSHTNIASRAEWIGSTLSMNSGLTESEKRKAAAGLNAVRAMFVSVPSFGGTNVAGFGMAN